MSSNPATTAEDLPPPEEAPRLASQAWMRVEQQIEAVRRASRELGRLFSHAALSEQADDAIKRLEHEIHEIQRSFADAWNQPHSLIKDRLARAEERDAKRHARAYRKAHERREKTASRRIGK